MAYKHKKLKEGDWIKVIKYIPKHVGRDNLFDIDDKLSHAEAANNNKILKVVRAYPDTDADGIHIRCKAVGSGPRWAFHRDEVILVSKWWWVSKLIDIIILFFMGVFAGLEGENV